MNVLALTIAIFANVIASLLLKKFALLTNDKTVAVVSVYPALILAGALTLLAVTFAAYTFLLRTWPVNLTYAFVTFGAQIGLVLCGAIFFAEQISLVSGIGLALVLAGLSMMVAGIR